MVQFLLTVAFISHRGKRRPTNQDHVDYHYPYDIQEVEASGALFALADGVGTLQGSDQAGRNAIEALKAHYFQHTSPNPQERLRSAIQFANTCLFEGQDDQATTLLAAVFQANHYVLAHVGDSVAYWLDKHHIKRLTQDHVEPNPKNPARMKLSRAVGYRDSVQADFSQGDLYPGGMLLLMSDGITRYLNENRLFYLCTTLSPHDAIKTMVESAYAAGGADNISALLVKVEAPCGSAVEHLRHVKNLMPLVTFTEPAPALPVTPSSTPANSHLGVHWSRVLGIMLVVVVLLVWGLLRNQPSEKLSKNSNSPSPVFTVTPLMVPSPTRILLNGEIMEGDRLHFNGVALTFTQISENVSSFEIIPGNIYTVADIYTDSLSTTWYRLISKQGETEDYGWITANHLPPYEIME